MITQNLSDPLLKDLLQHARPVKGRAAEDCFISSSEFAALDVSHEWMIDRTMVRSEPLILGGPKKSLKTSIVLDLAISLAAGFNTRFLGKFDVERPYRVGLISGESGKPTLKKKALAVCKAKGLSLPDLKIHWRFRMPSFSVDEEREAIAEYVRENRLDVMIFDPMYLGLFSENSNVSAGNVLQMGPLLQKVVDTCLPYGCTPV
jgi:RecA-family ATPase